MPILLNNTTQSESPTSFVMSLKGGYPANIFFNSNEQTQLQTLEKLTLNLYFSALFHCKNHELALKTHFY